MVKTVIKILIIRKFLGYYNANDSHLKSKTSFSNFIGQKWDMEKLYPAKTVGASKDAYMIPEKNTF